MGLLALMLLQESRRAARTSPTGELILLDDQDRSLWNREQIAEGNGAGASGRWRRGRFGPYTLQAAIAAVHAEAADRRGDRLGADRRPLRRAAARPMPSPVVELNRAVAVAMRDGPWPVWL